MQVYEEQIECENISDYDPEDKRNIMKAVIHSRYGKAEYLKIEEIPKPEPNKNEIRIKVKATTVTPSDALLRQGKFPLLFWIPVRLLIGFFRPRRKILGYEFSGIVDKVGEGVTKFKLGEEVFGGTYWKMSCHAEYFCISENSAIGPKPKNLNFFESAAVPDGASTAFHFLKQANLTEQTKILIYGASGSIGTYSIQLAKNAGAEVTAVCSERNFKLVKSLGADYVIDYQKDDYSRSGNKFDVIFDTVGRSSYSQANKALKEEGLFITTAFSLSLVLRKTILSFKSKKRIIANFTQSNPEKLKSIKELIENGSLNPVIDKKYNLSEIIDAHEYVETGRKRGNVVIIVDQA